MTSFFVRVIRLIVGQQVLRRTSCCHTLPAEKFETEVLSKFYSILRFAVEVENVGDAGRAAGAKPSES